MQVNYDVTNVVPKFSFSFIWKEHVLEEIQMVDSSKAIQVSEIPVKKILLMLLFLLILVKIMKGKSDLFAEVICIFVMNP